MRHPWPSVLLRPEVVALPIAIGIIIFLPKVREKYSLELAERRINDDRASLYFEDLDGDGASEIISAATNSKGGASIIIYRDWGSPVDQINLDSIYINFRNELSFLDLDGDGRKEITCLTLRKDSIFLNIHHFGEEGRKLRRSIYLDTLGRFDPELRYDRLNEITGHGFQTYTDRRGGTQLIMTISAGFSGYPRCVYGLNLETEAVMRSRHLGNLIGLEGIQDLDGDGRPELFLRASSADNDRWFDPSYAYLRDDVSWLIVLNDSLEFKFPPEEFPLKFSAVIPVLSASNPNEYFVIHKSNSIRGPEHTLYRYDTYGKRRDSAVLDQSNFQIVSDPHEPNIRLYYTHGYIADYDKELLKYRRKKSTPSGSEVARLDLAGDSGEEWIFTNSDKMELVVFSPGLKSVVSTALPNEFYDHVQMGLFKRGNRRLFAISDQKVVYLYAYRLNNIYYWQSLIYLGVYLAVWGLIKLSMQLQFLKDQGRRELEEQIADLQTRTIKNQLDPHFVFNAVNTISEMTLSDNKLEADRYIGELSDLMRKTLKGSDRISSMLREELDYVENYIRLQQIRLGNSFDYRKDLAPGIDWQVVVPKHILYTFVENAIKHGLHHLDRKGELEIRIEQQGKVLRMCIMDNGHGWDGEQNGERLRPSTGNGLNIMQRIFELYQKRYRSEIRLDIEDRKLSDGLSGTRVRIEIFS